jgi:hypothetical protein
MAMGELANALRVPQSVVEAWMRGHATMTTDKVALLLDLLEELDRRTTRD